MLKDVASFLVDNLQYIEYGGEVDFKGRTLKPVIITKDLKDDFHNYEEFYVPIFRVLLYENISDLKQYFCNKIYKEENMNISLFGDCNFINTLPSSLVLHNEVVSEIDNGYCEYGGYGEKVSYLLYRGLKIVKPILINREIEYFFNNSDFIQFVDRAKEVSLPKNRLNSIVFDEYRTFVQRLFKKELNFSFIFGSHAKGLQSACSDIDMLICLHKIDRDIERQFREWYFTFHYMYGKIPDFYYPGEIITEDILQNIISNNKNVEFKTINDASTFDALFYTQIFTDKKRDIIGNQDLLLKYEHEFRKFIPDFCNQIYELLLRSNMIKDDRENMKCLIALSCNDLLFFGKKLQFEVPEDKYANMVEKIDDGFLVKCLKKNQKL